MYRDNLSGIVHGRLVFWCFDVAIWLLVARGSNMSERRNQQLLLFDRFMTFDNWTLTKPEFSGAVLYSGIVHGRLVFDVLMLLFGCLWPGDPTCHKEETNNLHLLIGFLTFGNWIVTKPEFSGAVFIVALFMADFYLMFWCCYLIACGQGIQHVRKEKPTIAFVWSIHDIW